MAPRCGGRITFSYFAIVLSFAVGLPRSSLAVQRVQPELLASDSALIWKQLQGERLNYTPEGKKWLIILRGETFRGSRIVDGKEDHLACLPQFEQYQFDNARSVVQRIIQPLETRGNQISVMATSSENCPLFSSLISVFGNRLVASKEFDSTQSKEQASNLRLVFDLVSSTFLGPAGVAKEFGYVLMLRNDLFWELEVTDWLADYSNFNFYSHCEPGVTLSEFGGANCVWDTVHFMPSSVYPTFQTVAVECIKEGASGGHACYIPMLEALKQVDASASIGFINDKHERVSESRLRHHLDDISLVH